MTESPEVVIVAKVLSRRDFNAYIEGGGRFDITHEKFVDLYWREFLPEATAVLHALGPWVQQQVDDAVQAAMVKEDVE